MISNFTLNRESRARLSVGKMIVSMPFIYGMFPVLFILDIFLEIYHQVAFRLYGIPIVKRNDYIFIDRHKVEELSFMQKVNCVYCGYANGLLPYATEIARRTEHYWCPMKHENYHKAVKVQPQQRNFFDRK